MRAYSDVLHPSRPNVSKDELREKLGQLYKLSKDQVSVFGFRTQFGGGKSTGFALLYDSAEAMKKFEPHYRLVRYGQATKIEKASRQQRESTRWMMMMRMMMRWWWRWKKKMVVVLEEDTHDGDDMMVYYSRVHADIVINRQAEEEPRQGGPRNCQVEERQQGQEEINVSQDSRCNGFGYAFHACRCMVPCSFGLHAWVLGVHRLGVDAEGVVTSTGNERFCHQKISHIWSTRLASGAEDDGFDVVSRPGRPHMGISTKAVDAMSPCLATQHAVISTSQWDPTP
jgi:small subunit ribosomal protein S24e